VIPGLTEISLGCAQLGNLYRAITDEQASATVDAAWGGGIRYFDTAPHYGLGLSERRLGTSLSARPRAEYVISTKVGRLLEPLATAGGRDPGGFDVPATHRRVWDFTRDGVRRSLEQSLDRLRVDRVDIVYVHDPDEHYREVLDGAYPALEELRGEGVIGAIGAGMNQSAMLAEFARHTDMDVFMLAGRYTLLEQPALDDLLPLCVERGIGVVAAAVFNSGLLAKPDPSPGTRYNYSEVPEDLLRRARRIAAICEHHGTSLPAAALAFPRGHPAVVSVCVGARSAGQITRNLELASAPVPAELWAELQAEGLLRLDVPVPVAGGASGGDASRRRDHRHPCCGAAR
jgi:D-threo-aldose 1-dehydrogenase